MVTTVDAGASLRSRVGRLLVALLAATVLALAVDHVAGESHDGAAGHCVSLVLCAAATVAVALVIRPVGSRDRRTRRPLVALSGLTPAVAVAAAPRDGPTLAELNRLRC